MSPVVNPLDHLRRSPVAVMKDNARTFSFASRVFTEEQRNPIANLYSFCRFVDDCADEASPEEGLAWVRAIHDHLQTGAPSPWPELDQRVIQICRTGVRRRDLLTLVEGALFDLEKGKIQSEGDLFLYCYQVAGVVGLMMCPLIGATDPRAHTPALHMGIAMQLTNMARDLFEDYQMGRIYLPEDWWQKEIDKDQKQLRASDQDGARGAVTNECPDVIKFSEKSKASKTAGAVGEDSQSLAVPVEAIASLKHAMRLVTLAESYYDSGRKGLSFLPLRPRLAILIAAEVYRAIGLKLLKKQCKKNIEKRVFLNTSEKFWVAIKSLRQLLRPSFWLTPRQAEVHSARLYRPEEMA